VVFLSPRFWSDFGKEFIAETILPKKRVESEAVCLDEAKNFLSQLAHAASDQKVINIFC
jgi:hypothetical protein